jgi:adenosyl cobinamide kinase/adenosyl cobinamide phosphate guanylyltransferase
MFLDDELYAKVKQFKIDKPEDFQTLVNDLYRICENYYKPRLVPLVDGSFKDITQLLDRTFKLWDMFIAKLEKENWWLVDLLSDYSYKEKFLSNEQLREIYYKGK